MCRLLLTALLLPTHALLPPFPGIHLYGSVTAADVVESLQESALRKLGIRESNVRLLDSAASSGAAEGAAADATAAAGDATAAVTHVYKEVGEHRLLIEPRPGLWCPMTCSVESS